MSKIERRATWLELFYDLVMVLVIAKISHYLFSTPSITGLVTFVALYFMIWWVWMGFSYYADMYESDHWLFRAMIYLSMFGMMILAVEIEHLQAANYLPVIFAYLALRLLLWLTYVIAYLKHQPDRPFLIFYVSGFFSGILLWLCGALFQNLWFCLIGFLVEFCTPMFAYLFAKTSPQQLSHLDERLGLFLLIVLGETIASVTYATDLSHWGFENIVISALSFFIAIIMWRLYFSRIQEDVVNRSIRSNRITKMRSFAFGNSHVLIAIGLTLFGISLEWLIVKEQALNPLRAYTASLVIYLAVLTFNQWAASSLNCLFGISRRLGFVIVFIAIGFVVKQPLLLTFLLALGMWGLSALEQKIPFVGK